MNPAMSVPLADFAQSQNAFTGQPMVVMLFPVMPSQHAANGSLLGNTQFLPHFFAPPPPHVSLTMSAPAPGADSVWQLPSFEAAATVHPKAPDSPKNDSVSDDSLGLTPAMGTTPEGPAGARDSRTSVSARLQDDPTCEALLADLRREKTDRTIRSRVLRMPPQLAQALVHYLATNPHLIESLCMTQRGIVVAHLVERLGAAGSEPLLRYARANFMELALNQSGCIAVPRILASLKDAPLREFFELTMQHIASLIDHQFGNFIVKHFVCLKEREFSVRILDEYILGNVVRTATNKFGSHVLEELLKSLTLEDVYRVSKDIFGDANTLRALSHDRYANYCLQTLLRAIATGDAMFHSTCVSNLIGAVRGSPYEQNIMKSAAAGFRVPNDVST